MMTDRGGTAIVIVNYRTAALALDCVMALAEERKYVPDLTAIIVDGGSGDGSADVLREGIAASGFGDWVDLLPLAINGGFGWANNQAMLRLLRRDNPPEFIHLLNPDSRIEPQAVAALRDVMRANPRCAVAGSELLNPDRSRSGSAFRFPSVGRELVAGSNTHSIGRIFGIGSTLIQSEQTQPADWVTGASCMLRTEALRQTGLFDHGFFLYFEEVELMFRIKRAGWDILHVPGSRVVHIGGAATGVHEGKSVSGPAKPDYWFHSRRRFHALAYGPTRTFLAGAAWLFGNILWRFRTMFGPSGNDEAGQTERRALWRIGIRATAEDLRPHIAMPGDSLDQPPAWMRVN